MQEMLARHRDRTRHVAGAQRLDDGAVLVDAADRMRGGLVDRDHHRGAAEQIAQEARQIRIAERVDQQNVKRAGQPHRGGAVAARRRRRVPRRDGRRAGLDQGIVDMSGRAAPARRPRARGAPRRRCGRRRASDAARARRGCGIISSRRSAPSRCSTLRMRSRETPKISASGCSASFAPGLQLALQQRAQDRPDRPPRPPPDWPCRALGRFAGVSPALRRHGG